MTDVPLDVRMMTSADRGFVATTMTRSIVDCPMFRWVPYDLARELMAARVNTWLRTYRVAVAVAQSDDTQIIGFVAYHAVKATDPPHTVLYLYVKEGLRRMGVGWALLTLNGKFGAPLEVNALHWSRHCETLALKHPTLRYRPTWLRDPDRRQQQKVRGAPRPSTPPIVTYRPNAAQVDLPHTSSATSGSPNPSTGRDGRSTGSKSDPKT